MNRVKVGVFAGVFLAVLMQFAPAQNELTLESAISFALEHNSDIRIALNNRTIAENNASPGNAGILPNLTISAGTNYSKTDNTLNFSYAPEPLVVNGAVTKNNQGSLELSGVLFSGGKNYYAYQSLLRASDLSAIQSRGIIERILVSVIRNYYTAALLKENLSVAKDALEISKQRVERTKSRVHYGGSLSLELLNAEVDMHTDSVKLLNTALQYENAKRDLNLILGKEISEAIDVSPDVTFDSVEEIGHWLTLAKDNNADLKTLQLRLAQSELDLKSARSSFFPTLTGNVSYDISSTESESGTLQKGESAGLSAGLNLSFDLFTGFRKLKSVQNAKINHRSTEEELVDNQRTLEKEVYNAYATYENALQSVEVEKRNLHTLKLNFERTSEQYDFGQVTATQFRESQLNLISGYSRLINEKYTAKFAENELYRLSGILIEQFVKN